MNHSLSTCACAALACILASCGGSNKPDPFDGGFSTSGYAIDGYLAHAKVCVDINRDKLCSEGEPTTLTDDTGFYTLPANPDAFLTLEATDDTYDITSKSVTGRDLFLTAPPNSPVITPFTTLVQSLKETTGKSYAEAHADVVAQLGLGDVDLANFDFVRQKNERAMSLAKNLLYVFRQNMRIINYIDETKAPERLKKSLSVANLFTPVESSQSLTQLQRVSLAEDARTVVGNILIKNVEVPGRLVDVRSRLARYGSE